MTRASALGTERTDQDVNNAIGELWGLFMPIAISDDGTAEPSLDALNEPECGENTVVVP